MDKLIKRNYVTPGHPTAFGSPKILSDYYSISLAKAKAILRTVNTYTLHRDYRRPQIRNPYFIHNIRTQIQIDLIDVAALKQENSGTTFILMVIDCWSRYLWARPLLNKKAGTVLKAMRDIFREMGTLPRNVLCDKGTELKNVQFKQYLAKLRIKLGHPNSEVKCGIVERVNRTLQNYMYRYMTDRQTYKYIDVLQRLVIGYNARPHRTLQGLTPLQAEDPTNKDAVDDALQQHYNKARSARKKPKLEIGQTVRVKKWIPLFGRGYHEQWKHEIFEIVDINTTLPICMYMIKSADSGEVIKGGFYENELVRVEQEEYNIEKVLRKKTVRGVKMLYVKWQGYNNNHNSWINEGDVTRVYNKK